MKKIIIILFALSPLFGYSQVDSSSVKINLSIQAKDAEYLGSFIAFKADYDDLFDQLKLKMRVANPPLNTTAISVDSIQVKTWLLIVDQIRKDYIGIQAQIFNRLDASLRAKNNAYINRMLNDANSYDIRLYQQNRAVGRYNIRKQ